MKWLVLLGGLFVLVIFQTSTAPAFPIFGVGPHLLLVVLCCWAIVREPREVLILTPLAGLGMGLLAYQGLAVSVAALTPIGLAGLWWWGRSDSTGRSLQFQAEPTAWLWEWMVTIGVIAVCSAAHFTAHAIAVELTTTSVDWVEAVRTVLVGAVLGNMLLGAVVYWIVRLPTRRRAFTPVGSAEF